MSSDEYCECHNVIIFEHKFYQTSLNIFHKKILKCGWTYIIVIFRQLGENYKKKNWDSYFKGSSTSNQAQLKWRKFRRSLCIYKESYDMCSNISEIFYSTWNSMFSFASCFFFSLSFCLHLIANAICNYGNVEHGYHGAYGWCCIAQICNGTMYIRFTLTLICWICMFGILLGFYNIIMHAPFLLGLRCHYTNVGSVPKQMLNELMIACMLMFM